MKKLLLASVAVFAFTTGSASAADVAPVYKAPPPVRPACAQFGGFYVGGLLGYGYYDHRFKDRDGLGANVDTGLPGQIDAQARGWNGGIEGGYNWQRGCTVFGVEADWSWTSLNANEFVLDGDQVAGGITDSVTVSSRLRSFGTFRLRTGIVVDDVFVYVTGGIAGGRFNRTWTFFQDGGPTAVVFAQDSTRWGWTAGVGTEWALPWFRNWSLKSEFLYMRFNQDRAFASGNAAIGIGNTGVAYRLDSEDSMWVTRIGINYRFGGGGGYGAY
jgi:outer membrane immunogenic protein